MRTLLVFVLAALGAFAVSGCSVAQCNTACESSVTLSTTTTASTSQIAAVTVCVGATCASAATAMNASNEVTASFTAGFGSGSLTVTAAGDVTAQVLGTNQDFHDGDVWSLRLDDTGGTALVDKTSPPTTYQRQSVCGVVCAQATIAL